MSVLSSPETPFALPAMSIAPRLGALRARLGEAGCDALLVTKLENVRYLTGFSGSAGMVLVDQNGATFVSDGRYGEQAAEQLAAAGVEAAIHIGGPKAQQEALADAAKGRARIGLEAAACTWAQMRRFAEVFETAELVPTTGVIEALRVVKDEGELARIEMACDIADVALAQVKGRLADKPSEAEFAAELEFEMRRRGADGPSFDTIVGSGANGAMPHARPTRKPIQPGELIVIDFGALVDGYHSDMTRTLCVGDVQGEAATLLDAVATSQRAGVSAVRAGATAGEVDAACREVLVELGYGEVFIHSTGHGVGLEIHEAPSVSSGAEAVLPVGSIVTVEPGAYLAGRFGARIEDTLVVTEDGARVLTKSTKDATL